MAIVRVAALRNCIVMMALASALPVCAQGTKVFEDDNIGVKLSIPSGWQAESRRADIYVNCAPGKEDRGRPACYFTIGKSKVPPEQRTINDADRLRLRAEERRILHSARDTQIAGFPAYEVVGLTGKNRDDATIRSVYVIVPGAGKAIWSNFLAMGVGTGDQFAVYEREVAKALGTLMLLK